MTSETRRAVLITATEPEPRRYGKQVVLGGILDHLVDRLGPDRVDVVLIGNADQDRPPVPYRRHLVPKPGAAGQVTSVLRDVVLPFGSRPRRALQEAALHSGDIAARLRHLLDGIDPDLEIWDTVRMGQYAPEVPRRTEPPVRRLLYADDLFSERYAAMLADAGDAGNPGGEFQKLLPGPARKLLANPAVHRPLLRLERDLVAVAEERQPAWFDGTYLISAEETGRLQARIGTGPGRPLIGTLPPMLREPKPLERVFTGEGTPEFTFIGGFDYAPNVDGLDWFLRTCRTAVQAAVPGAVINVVGAGTERGLPSAAGWGSSVRFLGWVDDLDAVLAGSAALLSPLRSGSGVKIKVLEALGRGLPVVATQAGVQGINAQPGAGPESSGLLVGDTPEALAGGLRRALDPETNAALSRAARQAWDTWYSPAVVRERYDEIFGLA